VIVLNVGDAPAEEFAITRVSHALLNISNVCILAMVVASIPTTLLFPDVLPRVTFTFVLTMSVTMLLHPALFRICGPCTSDDQLPQKMFLLGAFSVEMGFAR